MLAASCRQLQASSLCSPKMSTTVIRNGRIIDPVNGRDSVEDLFIVDGKIANQSAAKNQQSKSAEIDASGLIVAPGLIDMHVHLREPGFAPKETIASGARAAAARRRHPGVEVRGRAICPGVPESRPVRSPTSGS